jgi:hypothetical protein
MVDYILACEEQTTKFNLANLTINFNLALGEYAELRKSIEKLPYLY